MEPVQLVMVWHGLTNQNNLKKKWIRQKLKEVCEGGVKV